ncbi:MAG: endo-1,4-beta-xylanase [Treponema sp.]|jgi:endo-1,4-beta-xylanase|nr:endo-1,4-beta-xylanase [Treponema sp.]
MKKNYFKTRLLPLSIAVLFVFTTCLIEDTDPSNMMNLEPMKDQFASYFMIGNIFSPNDVGGGMISNDRITRHYAVLTAENHMKPSYLNPSRGKYSFDTANNMVNAARASGMKVVGHTLLWHSQIPKWQIDLGTDGNTSKETALEYMNEYITRVVTEFKGKIYSWDVLNEVFPDGVSASANWETSMRSENPWFKKIGADFVYEGFKAARLADSDAILYYNDYSLDNVGKATMVRDMVRDVNNDWLIDPQYDNRLLIEGIGMQSHHNTGVSAASVKASLDLFKPLGVRIAISELDVLSQSWGEYSPNRNPPTEAGKARAAQLYGEYFKLFLDYSDIIDRVTFWGVYDEQSWRKSALPLIFHGNARSFAKDSYYKIIETLENYQR